VHTHLYPAYQLRQGLANFLPELALNLDSPDFCFLSNGDYSHCAQVNNIFKKYMKCIDSKLGEGLV
jgi:hypothetical protein